MTLHLGQLGHNIAHTRPEHSIHTSLLLRSSRPLTQAVASRVVEDSTCACTTANGAVLAADQLPSTVPAELTLKILDIPPTVRLPALVKHILAQDTGLLSETICNALNLPQVTT